MQSNRRSHASQAVSAADVAINKDINEGIEKELLRQEEVRTKKEKLKRSKSYRIVEKIATYMDKYFLPYYLFLL